MNTWLVFVSLILVSVGGCSGTGQRIDLTIPGSTSAASPPPSTGPRIAVLPFKDLRVEQAHLGQREHLWGGQSYFDLPNGTVSQATAQAFVEYLARHGWRAFLEGGPNTNSSDVTIQGTITELSVDAKSGFMRTDLSVKNSLAFQISNHSDQSLVRERVSGAATDRVFWFHPDDAQRLLSELLESNFQKFMNDVRLDGTTMRLSH